MSVRMIIMDKNILKDKIKKLTEAVYRVSDLYPDQEPLKWSLRDSAVHIYINLYRFLDFNGARNSKALEEIIGSLSGIIHTLDLASLGGFISDVNFDILKREYSRLKDIMEGEGNAIISEKKLLISPDLSDSNKDSGSKGQISKGHKRQNSKGHTSVGPSPQRPSVALAGKQNKRQEVIINFLKNHGKKTINEISQNFQDISNKSIQRDVISLVERGILSAEGERRWRVYFLTKSAI